MADFDIQNLPDVLPDQGAGEEPVYDLMETVVRAASADLGALDALAHMDPAPAMVAARLVGLNAQYNQNLLHPDLSPFATVAERTVIHWLAPFFGMVAGHMCAGSTLANLTALWCAREHGAKRVIASADAHISVPKSAAILGMAYEPVAVDEQGRMDIQRMAGCDDSALVLSAGTTGRGVIDDMLKSRPGKPAWVHVDAAWAGPLCLTDHKVKLNGIAAADSVSVSAHKWLFQPKESALVLFKNSEAQEAVSFGGAYLAVPNVGVQGSRGAAGVALLGTLLAWGRAGLEEQINRSLELSEQLALRLDEDKRTALKQFPETGVINWRPKGASSDQCEAFIKNLGGTVSRTVIDAQPWVRQVSANMHADLEVIWQKIDRALGS